MAGPTATSTTYSGGWRSGLALGVESPRWSASIGSPGCAARAAGSGREAVRVAVGAAVAGSVQPLPVPGKVEIGDEEVELHPAEGHTRDGMALMARWCGVLVCGDYSDVEIPTLVSLGDWAALARLAGSSRRRRSSRARPGAEMRRGAARARRGHDVLDAVDAFMRRSRACPRAATARSSAAFTRRTCARRRLLRRTAQLLVRHELGERVPLRAARSARGSDTPRISSAEKAIPANSTKPSVPKSAAARTAAPRAAPIM